MMKASQETKRLQLRKKKKKRKEKKRKFSKGGMKETE